MKIKSRWFTEITSIIVRIYYYLLACLVVTGSSNAFAKGGLGGALGAMLEVLLMFAVVGGLIGGALCARFLGRTLWKWIGFLFLVGLVATFTFPLIGLFLGIPMMVFIAVFASVSYLTQGGLFQRIVVPPPKSMDGDRQESDTGRSFNVLRWIAATYVFWAVASLANIELLGFLVIPPAFFLYPETIEKFLPFVLPPLVVALAIGIIVTVFVVKRSRTRKYVAPFIFNASVLLTFFISAEVFRSYLMSQSLLDHKPNHFESSSFLNSVLSHRAYFRGQHASFDENGKTYHWSYSERRFFQTP